MTPALIATFVQGQPLPIQQFDYDLGATPLLKLDARLETEQDVNHVRSGGAAGAP